MIHLKIAIFVMAWMWIALVLEDLIPELIEINYKEYKDRKYIFISLLKNMIAGPFVLLKLIHKK